MKVTTGGLNQPCNRSTNSEIPTWCSESNLVCYNLTVHPNRVAYSPVTGDICKNFDDSDNGLRSVCGQGYGSPCCSKASGSLCKNSTDVCLELTDNDIKNNTERINELLPIPDNLNEPGMPPIYSDPSKINLPSYLFNYNPWWSKIILYEGKRERLSPGICINNFQKAGEPGTPCLANDKCDPAFGDLKCIFKDELVYKKDQVFESYVSDKIYNKVCEYPNKVKVLALFSSPDRRLTDGSSSIPLQYIKSGDTQGNGILIAFISNMGYGGTETSTEPIIIQEACNYIDDNSFLPLIRADGICFYPDVGNTPAPQKFAYRYWVLNPSEMTNLETLTPPGRPPDNVIIKDIKVYLPKPTPVYGPGNR